MYVEKILGKNLVVRRAQDNTKAQNHILGEKVYSITEEDNKLIEFGDDFGFGVDIF